MRVAILSLHTSPLAQPGQGDAGGLNVYVTNTARVLCDLGHQVTIFTADPAWDGPDSVTRDQFEVRHLRVSATGKDDLPQHMTELAAQLARTPEYRDADWVWAHYWISAQTALMSNDSSASRKPVVVSFHTIGAVKNRDTGTSLEPAQRLEAEAQIARDAHLLVANTPLEARAMRELLDPNARIVVAQPGVNHKIFTPGETCETGEPGDARLPSAPASPHTLVCVGRMQYIKGTDIMMRALAELRQTGMNVRVEFLGGGSGGPDTQDFERFATELGVSDGVDITPPVPPHELVTWYRRADLVIVPSRSESFGFVAAEAAASGACVVASRVGGLPSVVVDGETGVLFEPGDHVGLARAITELLSDPDERERMGQAGVLHAQSFTWDTCVRNVLNQL